MPGRPGKHKEPLFFLSLTTFRGGICYPPPQNLQENTSLAERGGKGSLPALPQTFPEALASRALGEGRGPWEGRGGEERGGGRSSTAAQPRDEWSLCAAAAAPLPRQPSAEEGTGPTPLPLPHPPHPGPSVLCLLSGTPARTRSSTKNSGFALPGVDFGWLWSCQGVWEQGIATLENLPCLKLVLVTKEGKKFLPALRGGRHK